MGFLCLIVNIIVIGKRKSVQPNRFDVDSYCDNEEQLMLQQALKVMLSLN